MSDRYNIVCLSNQLWLKDYWTNKSHVMSRLGRLGHRVLFVEPPINTGNIFIRQVLEGAWPVKRLVTQTKVEPTSGVLIYSPLNTIPNMKVTNKWHIGRIKKLAAKHFDSTRKTLLWVYHVQLKGLADYLDAIPHDLLIYDCVDNYLGFPENASKFATTVLNKDLPAQEAMLAKRADLVFATAPGLVDRLIKLNPKTYFTPNVGDYEKFKDAKAIKTPPEDIKRIKKPIVGFTGALDEHKFDLELFRKLAAELSEVSFVLIGSLVRKDKVATKESLGLENLSNVYLLGTRPYDSIPGYYGAFDAFIIPYQLNDLTVGGCFPVKFHDALAAGLPVVVTDMPVYTLFKEVCYISKSREEFVDNVRRALREDSQEKIKVRQEVARQNNWDGKVQRLLALIDQSVKDRP